MDNFCKRLVTLLLILNGVGEMFVCLYALQNFKTTRLIIVTYSTCGNQNHGESVWRKKLMFSYLKLLDFNGTFTDTCTDTDARVYCQDSHATSWIPFGHSCPVVCQNIINAIQRLKIMDFESIIYNKPQVPPAKMSHVKKSNSMKQDENNDLESPDDYTMVRANRHYHRKANNENYSNTRTANNKKHKANAENKNRTIDETFYKDVIRLTQLASKTFKGRCNKSKKSDLFALLKCARKSNIDGSFLAIMTKLLNKYSNSVYKFTEQMTEVLLEKIFGENTDLRNNIFDVNKLLGYLRQALHRHKEHESRDVIALSSKHCLTVSLPGCFCKPGFVESSGQCVKPADCVGESSYDEYLARVIVT